MNSYLLAVVALLPILGSLAKTIPESQIALRDNLPVVQIDDGKIIGSYNYTVDKKTPYVSYRGIPFAKPPVGDLRFSAPVKNDQWNGYLDATQDASVCIQGSGDNVRGDEDCLYANVYAPTGAQNLAVMVWIYGGAFTGGDSSYDSFGPDYFLEDGVIFVSFNYRLGIFGFYSTEDKVASGNWGLKDQVLALKWVKENIAKFGGDPNRITIFGESAGGASVSYLLQIPQAKGLFNAAIVQSGNSLNLWARSTKARQAAFQVGYNLGIPTLISRTLTSRLRAIDAYRLQKTAMSVLTQVYALNPLRGLPWAPVKEVDGPESFFTAYSDDYLQSGEYPSKVPVMMGYTSNEGAHAHWLPDRLRNYLRLFDSNTNNLVPFSLSESTAIRALAGNKIKLKFFGLKNINSQFDEAVRLINIDQFTRGAMKMAESMSHFAPVYFYNFGYEGVITGERPYTGVGHAEELIYLFRSYTDNYIPLDLEVRAKLIRLWTNFAKTFNPTPAREPLLGNIIWPQVNPISSNFDYVWLNSTIVPDVNPSAEDYGFYKELFEKYGEPPFTTY